MEFKTKILDNDLTIIGEANKSAKSAAVGFFVKTGSRDEEPLINGISHFLEHMVFKGTEKLSAFEVNEAFDRTGAHFNAFTSEENTVYYAAVLPEYLFEVTQLWTELMRPALRSEDFSIEKNVIKEEIAMYKDQPSFDVVERCRNLHFAGHPCGNSVLGSEQSIDALTAGKMQDYFARRYSPNNMVVACAGNFDWDQLCSVLQKPCSNWEKHSAPRLLEHRSGSRKKERLEKPNLSCEHICLMSDGISLQDPRRFAAALLATVIGDDVGSWFFWELVDKALAETAVMHFSGMDGTGLFYSYICCRSENVPKVIETVKRIFDALLRQGVTGDELTKAKNKILSALVIKNELPMGRLLDVGFNWVYLGRYRTLEDDIDAVRSVTAGEVNSLIEQLKPGEFTKFEIGPAK
jgi:predicted Zn-dependent peptidase